MRPLLLIRINRLIGLRIGHLAANTEFYLCEIDAGINVPKQKYIDIAFFGGARLANKQLGKMWKRHLHIWPKWLLEPLFFMNRSLAGGAIHEVENSESDFQYGRDTKSLMANSPAHLSFTPDEEARGKAGLTKLGILGDAEFVCLIVRDSAYLNAVLPNPEKWNYHSYRDSDIQSYVMAADALAERGFYVLRMGEVVNTAMKANNPKVIDYATTGFRTDFMDIYLGAKCAFCITVGTGYDAVPMIFRRPMVFVNAAPMGLVSTFIKDSVYLPKKHWLTSEKRLLTVSEIFDRNVGFCVYSNEYQREGVELVDNSPEEIKDAVFELLERIKKEWVKMTVDDDLQKKFWEIFPLDIKNSLGRNVHGKVLTHFSAKFLRENRDWLA